MQEKVPFYEVSDSIVEGGGRSVLKCMQCGTCTAVCPWNLSTDFGVRTMMHLMQLGLEGYEQRQLWMCATCLRCETACPREVKLTEIVRSARAIMYEIGSVPRTISAAVGSIRVSLNPWQGSAQEARKTFEKVGLDRWNDSCDYLIFPCCTNVFDPDSRRTLEDILKIFRSVGIKAGAIEPLGICCGDLAYRTGAGDVFERVKKKLTEQFVQCSSAEVVVISPHCYVTLKRQFPHLKIIHYTQVLWKIIEEGRIHFKDSSGSSVTVTYHDPCYAGRYEGIYDEPRQIIRAVPAVNFVEMERNRSYAICCGGGGGGAFSEVSVSQRLGVIRMREALGSGAETVLTACPFCKMMLSDGAMAGGMEGKISVEDIASFLLRYLIDSGY